MMTAAVDMSTVSINGCSAPKPDLDEATCVLEQAHALLAFFNMHQAEQPDLVADAIRIASLRGIETLLEHGIRNLIVGHQAMLLDRASARKAKGGWTNHG